MNFPIPSFIPVPGAETMQLISIVSLIVGICITVTKLHTEAAFSVFFLGLGSDTETPSFSFSFSQARLKSDEK